MASDRRPLPGEDFSGEQGGDPACWAHLLCEDCGRVLEPGEDHRCDGSVPEG